MASAAVADNFASRDEAKKTKQLQEARAAGTAAPEMDAATGRMINPHNPQFITQAPWYLNQSKPSLKHQQAWNLQTPGTKDWYKRGTKGDVKTKFIKGACENCGATTHDKKTCMERPRAVGAKLNGKNLMPDEYIESLVLDYDGKRDRWNGFQPDDYKDVIEEWEKVETERRRVKAAEMEERAKLKERLKAQKKALKKKRKQRRRQLRRQAEGRDTDTGTDTGGDTEGDSDTDTDTDSDSDASDDEDLGEKMKDFDKTTATVATKDDKLRTTTRNLRIREDTAKYLLNLDVNSAFYDPKSRSMREDPLKHLKDDEKGAFRGDNFVRSAGDAKQLTQLMIFAWESYKHGEKIHDTAQPTQALRMWQVFKQRSKDLKADQQRELVEKYGGEEHLNPPTEMLFAQNDNYVEYSRDGRILKGRERAFAKSKYEEDILTGNHSSIWGSWFDSNAGKWGFACCHQTLKNAYCVPLKRHDAVEDAPETEAETNMEVVQQPPEHLETSSSDESGDDSSSGDAEATEQGLEERRQRLAQKRQARALKGMALRQTDKRRRLQSNANSQDQGEKETADQGEPQMDVEKVASPEAESDEG
mmetsp:Transcript_73088/g.144947  ORF Transcript_73088/g.144947 Transcript_73088/m.144947 type:complete len:588 (-) Transcript_73088:74-1837(-)|eukprot:CAMPEP_0172723024 /NCGR_PEP_ID=MMETSP1074-20121228/82827_1 /TAXON_ID=2916 /ORGANISM="Ceratium fusus, Strain PA161109" /LENGTH=587 /DNA_ID=CAMNT_0013549181 /DNA_START=34 /DNA_END=1797 /DNA_ORIENTATION=+